MPNFVEIEIGSDGLMYAQSSLTGRAQTPALPDQRPSVAPSTSPKEGRPSPSPVSAKPPSGPAGPFSGSGVFTAWDPDAARHMKTAPSWVAVMPDKVTQELVNGLREQGSLLVIWEPVASQAGVNAVNKWGAAGYIAQAEGPGELAAAQAIASQIKVPKALVSNNFMSSYPPGWIAMPEAYTNNNPNATADQVTRDAKARGAATVVPIIGLFSPDSGSSGAREMTAAEYEQAVSLAGRAGASGFGAYLAEEAVAHNLVPSITGDGSGPSRPPDTKPGGPFGPGNPQTPVTKPAGSSSGPSRPPDTKPGGPFGPGNPQTPASPQTARPGPTDWGGYFSDWGLPADVVKGLNEAIAGVADVQQAIAIGLGYLRGTSWYKTMYPGISAGFANGLVSNEAQYRQMLNQENESYMQYKGRPIGKEEFAASLAEGVDPGTVSRRLQAEAYVSTYGPDIQFALGAQGDIQPDAIRQAMGAPPGGITEGELTALGRQQAGLQNPVGMKLAKALEEATRRLQGVFQGQLATPAGLSLSGAGLAAQGTAAPIDIGR